MLSESQDRHPGMGNLAPINTAGFSITLTGAGGSGDCEQAAEILAVSMITSSP